jgi:hypothetical protein
MDVFQSVKAIICFKGAEQLEGFMPPSARLLASEIEQPGYKEILREGSNRLIQVAKNFEAKTPTWDDYIFHLAALPDLILGKYKFIPGTQDEVLYADRIRHAYLAIAEWLRYLVTPSLYNPSLHSPEKIRFKPTAELAKAIFDLAVQTYPRSAALQTYFERPADIWFEYEYQSLNRAIWECGLVNGHGSYPRSKEQIYQNSRELTDWLDGVIELEEMNRTDTLRATEEATALDFLLSEARQISESGCPDQGFNFTFKNAQKKIKAEARDIRRHGRAATFRDGQALPTGKNAPRKKKKKRFNQL